MAQSTSPSPSYPMFPEGAAAVTPSDTVTFAPSVVYVGGMGNVKVTCANGDVVTFTNIQGGGVIPVRVKQVFATNTTATTLVRIY